MYSLCRLLLCLVLIIVAVTSAWREPSLAPFLPRLLPFICQQQLCYLPGSSKPLMKAALFSTEISLLMLSLAHIQSERMWCSLKIDWALYITQLPKAFYTHDHWDNCKIILQGGTALLSPPFIWKISDRKKDKTHEIWSYIYKVPVKQLCPKSSFHLYQGTHTPGRHSNPTLPTPPKIKSNGLAWFSRSQKILQTATILYREGNAL